MRHRRIKRRGRNILTVKVLLIITALVAVLLISLFSFGLKEQAIRGMASDLPEYNCGKDDLCTSCIVQGQDCSCGKQVCSCGNRTVDREKCELY